MKKTSKKNKDVAGVMVQIQEQLAVLDQKLDSFMTKSLTELAQALNASKPAPRPMPPAPLVTHPRLPDHPGRPMFAVICYDCGKDCEIPFKPSGGRPVYCKECFAKRKSGQAHKPLSPREQIVPNPPSVGPKPIEKVPTRKKPAAKKKPTAKKKVVKKTAKRK